MNRTLSVAGLAIGFSVLLLAFLWSPGTSDVPIWMIWLNNALRDGMPYGYRGTDYPPLTVESLWIAAKVGAGFGLSGLQSLKVLILLASGVALGTFYATTRHVGALLAFFVGWFLSTTPLGYLDVFYAPALILALWCLKTGRPALFGALFMTACMFKWQPVFLAPFTGVYLLFGTGGSWRRVLWAGLGAGIVLALVALVFDPWEMVQALRRISRQPVLSGNALNVWWIVTHALHVVSPDRFGPLVRGVSDYILAWDIVGSPWVKLPFLLSYALALLAYWRGEKTFERLMQGAVIGYLCYFMLATSVHENHLLPAALLAPLAWGLAGGSGRQAWIIAALVNVNLLVFYGVTGTPIFGRTVMGLDMALVLAFVGVAWFAVAYGRWVADGLARPSSR